MTLNYQAICSNNLLKDLPDKHKEVISRRFGFKSHVSFLLTIGKPFQRYGETQDFHAFWAVDRNAFNFAQKSINDFAGRLEDEKTPMALPKEVLPSYIEISKNILKGPDGLYGLADWPEINPRGVKDKAYLVMKKEQKPLHFTKV